MTIEQTPDAPEATPQPLTLLRDDAALGDVGSCCGGACAAPAQ